MYKFQNMLQSTTINANFGQIELISENSNWKNKLLNIKDKSSSSNLFIVKNDMGEYLLILQNDLDDFSSVNSINNLFSSRNGFPGYPMYYIQEAIGGGEISSNLCYDFFNKTGSVILKTEQLNIKKAFMLITTKKYCPDLHKQFLDFLSFFKLNLKLNTFLKSPFVGRTDFYLGLFQI